MALQENVVSLQAAIEYANSVDVDIYLDTAISSNDYENVFCLVLQYNVSFLELLARYKIRNTVTIYSGLYVQKQIDELEEMKRRLKEIEDNP